MSKGCRQKNNSWLQYYRELIGTWTLRSNSFDEASDAVHDSIVNYLTKTTHTKNTRAYLHRSVQNSLIDRYRRNALLDWVSVDDINEIEHPRAFEPDEHMRATQLIGALSHALAELPEDCRRVFVLHRFDGLPQREIAKQLGVSVNMVERHMIRAMRHLRIKLDVPQR